VRLTAISFPATPRNILQTRIMRECDVPTVIRVGPSGATAAAVDRDVIRGPTSGNFYLLFGGGILPALITACVESNA
jgi:hypothetical protein